MISIKVTALGRDFWLYRFGQVISVIGDGCIIGAIFFGKISLKFKNDVSSVLGIAMIGIGIAALPWIPNIILPLGMMLMVGVGSMMINIPLGTQITLARPDAYRARIGTSVGFLVQISAPLGISLTGILISSIGLNWTMFISGFLTLILSPLLFLIPKFSTFLRANPEEASRFYLENYPKAFFEEKIKNPIQ